MQGNSKNWTLTHIFKGLFADLRRHPVGTFLLIGVLPNVWMSGVDFLLLPILSGHFSHHASRFLIGLARAAWGSAVLGGAFLLALEVARGGSPRFSNLIRGIRFAFSVAAVSIINELATGLVPFINETYHFGPGMLLIFVVVMVLTLVMYTRCSLSVPIIVDRGLRAWWAIPESWMTTRSYFWRIAVTYCALGIVLFPAALLFPGAFGARCFGALADPVIILAVAHIYIRVTPARSPSSNTADDVQFSA